MPKVWRLDWEEHTTFSVEILADTEEEALRYWETGGEFHTKPMAWSEIAWGPSIVDEREEFGSV